MLINIDRSEKVFGKGRPDGVPRSGQGASSSPSPCHDRHPPAQRSMRTNWRAALTSSSRPVGVIWGAERKSSGFERASVIPSIARTKASSVGLVSVLVG
jgi:hypothetical protein